MPIPVPGSGPGFGNRYRSLPPGCLVPGTGTRYSGPMEQGKEPDRGAGAHDRAGEEALAVPQRSSGEGEAVSERSIEAIERGRKILRDCFKDKSEAYRDLFVRLWETAADELCACEDAYAVRAVETKILRNKGAYGLSSDHANELMRILASRKVYSSFEESLPGFQAEMLAKYRTDDRERFLALVDSISAWRQWWIENTPIRNMTDFHFGLAVLKVTKWQVENA